MIFLMEVEATPHLHVRSGWPHWQMLVLSSSSLVREMHQPCVLTQLLLLATRTALIPMPDTQFNRTSRLVNVGLTCRL